jgi:hypothetical protein
MDPSYLAWLRQEASDLTYVRTFFNDSTCVQPPPLFAQGRNVPFLSVSELLHRPFRIWRGLQCGVSFEAGHEFSSPIALDRVTDCFQSFPDLTVSCASCRIYALLVQYHPNCSKCAPPIGLDGLLVQAETLGCAHWKESSVSWK